MEGKREERKSVLFLFLFFFGGTGVQTQGFTLAGRKIVLEAL
jgi:hypothetical protein